MFEWHGYGGGMMWIFWILIILNLGQIEEVLPHRFLVAPSVNLAIDFNLSRR